MHNMFEFSLRDEFPFDRIAMLISEYLNIPIWSIVSENDYWDGAVKHEKDAVVGLTVRNAACGFKTYVTGVTELMFKGDNLSCFATKTSKFLGTELTLPDYRNEKPGVFLVYCPNGTVLSAVDASHNGINEVEILDHPRK